MICGPRTFTFGELAEEAASRSPPRSPALRTSGKARLVGQSLQRLDAPAKSDGSFRFAGDVRHQGMLFASVRMAPPGGKLRSFSREAVKGAPGVRHLAARDTWVAIVADSWWAADRALKASAPVFSGDRSPADIRPIFEKALAEGDASEWFSRGDYEDCGQWVPRPLPQPIMRRRRSILAWNRLRPPRGKPERLSRSGRPRRHRALRGTCLRARCFIQCRRVNLVGEPWNPTRRQLRPSSREK